MQNYNFNDLLSPYDFELLCKDLLQNHLETYIESFTKGRDGGIDLRAFCTKSETLTLIQCKNYKQYSNLLSNLKIEVEKVSNLKPEKYIIATSVGLTPNNKKELFNLFSPFIKNETDIFGKDDLLNILSSNPDLERKHYKLWFSSTNIFLKLINNDVYTQTEFELKEIQKNSKKWIFPNCINRAHRFLDLFRVIIISGEPGIGKTTLARIISLELMGRDYEFIYCHTINDLFKVFDKEKKQFFYYDDFLGQNFFNPTLKEPERKKLFQILMSIEESRNKYLILTTREYILNQANNYFSSADSSKLNVSRFILDLKKFEEFEKAKILYNHLYFSELPKEYLENIIHSKNYLKIVTHKNYNPRLIESITKTKEIINPDDSKRIKPESYIDYCVSVLDNPSQIWEEAFLKNLTESSNIVLSLVLTLSTPVYYGDLLETYKNYKEQTNTKFKEIEFKNSLKELETTFLKYDAKWYDTNLIVEYSNPSVQDYLVNYFQNNISKIIPIVENSSFYDQLISIFSFNNSTNKHKIILDDSTLDLLKKSILTNIEVMPSKKVKYTISYNNFLSRVYQIIKDNSILKDKIFYAEIRHKVVIHLLTKKLTGTNIKQIKDVIDFFKISNELEATNLFDNMIELITSNEDLYDFKNMGEYLDDFEDWEILIEESAVLKDKIMNILKDTVASEDEEEIKELLNEIEDLQYSFHLNEKEVESIRLEAEALEFTSSEPEYDHEEYLMDKYANEKKESDISDLFNTLTE